MLCIDQSDVSAQQFQGTARRFCSGGAAAAAAAVDLRHRRRVFPVIDRGFMATRDLR